MTFGEKIRELRKAKNLSQRDLAAKVKVNFTYISKIENEKLDFGDYPSEELILKLAKALEADADELLILAKKVPENRQEAGHPAARRLPQAGEPRRRGPGQAPGKPRQEDLMSGNPSSTCGTR